MAIKIEVVVVTGNLYLNDLRVIPTIKRTLFAVCQVPLLKDLKSYIFFWPDILANHGDYSWVSDFYFEGSFSFENQTESAFYLSFIRGYVPKLGSWD